MKRRPWKTAVRKGIASMAAFVLMLSLVPAQAFALGEITTWQVPPVTATTCVKDGKTCKYITSAAHRRVEAAADYLGISNVTVDPTKTGKAWDYTSSTGEAYEALSKSARFGIFGTEVNENLNPYYGNYYHNIYQDYIGGTDYAPDDDCILLFTENVGPNNADTIVVDKYGTSTALYYRPDILFGAGSIVSSEDSTQTLQYGNSLTAVSDYTELVNKIRNKELGTNESGEAFYKDGDENYDPYYVSNGSSNLGGIHDSIQSIWNLALSADAIIKNTAESETPHITRYEDPVKIANLYEEYIKGNQLAVLKAIDKGTVARKTIAVVESIDTDSGAVTFVDKSKNRTVAGQKGFFSYYEYLESVTNNIIDVNALENNIGYAKDIMDCSAVYLSSSTDKDNLVAILAAAGYTDESAYPDLFTTRPDAALMLQNGEAENAMCFGFAIGYAYPEIINPVDSLAFYYQSFYHIKASSLADALGMQISNMSLPSNVELNLNTYSQSDYQSMLDEALFYYADNQASIDAAYPTLTPSAYFTMPTEPADNSSDSGNSGNSGQATPASTANTSNVTKITVNAKKVNANTINKAIESANANKSKINTIVIGKKVKTINAKAFKNFPTVKTLIVKSKKLKKSTVKKCLGGSKVKTVKTKKTLLKKYKKIFVKSVVGKSVKVKKA